jgi:hypothetical protein
MALPRTKLLRLNRELVELVSEAANAEAIARVNHGVGRPEPGEIVPLLFSPAELYGRAISVLATHGADSDGIGAADISRSIRFQALKIQTGDVGYVCESLVAQSSWLNALALALSKYATTLNATEKARVGALILKIQTTTARLLESLTFIAGAHASPR